MEQVIKENTAELTVQTTKIQELDRQIAILKDRERKMYEATTDAIKALERTRTIFKSKAIAQIREKLQKAREKYLRSWDLGVDYIAGDAYQD